MLSGLCSAYSRYGILRTQARYVEVSYTAHYLTDGRVHFQKLKPFFPPLEPLQSLNLRAALYRCLNELKKNGVLGRESVLRKTMLDECKGEKFLEILALFSTTVLKKVLSIKAGNRRQTAVAVQYSTASALSAEKQALLLPLSIAYKVALLRILHRKNENRQRYAAFNDLLVNKAKAIHQRLHQAKATPRSKRLQISDRDVAVIKRQLTDHWIGDQKWLDVMLHGDRDHTNEAFLITSFDGVWKMVEEGHKPEEATPEKGLLEKLQLRVQEQQTRLQNWRTLHTKFHKNEMLPTMSRLRAQSSTPPVNFTKHLDIQVRSARSEDREPTPMLHLRPEYSNIIFDMHTELKNMLPSTSYQSTGSRLRRASIPHAARQRQKTAPNPSQAKDVSMSTHRKERTASRERKDYLGHSPFQGSTYEPTVMRIDSEATLIGQPSTGSSTTPAPPLQPSQSSHPSSMQDSIANHRDISEVTSELSASTDALLPEFLESIASPASPSPLPTPSLPPEPPVLQQALSILEDSVADQIISSVANATPSPTKKSQPRLSLLERTRMSMAHTGNFQPVIEDSLALLELPFEEPQEVALDRRASLLDRTRLSMAAMSQSTRPLPKKGRKSTARHSNFPVNQFDTPRNRKSFHTLEEAKSGGTTPKEELFSDDIDYDRVFKSRPRVAQSPIFSPDERAPVHCKDGEAVDENGDGVISGLGLGDVEDYDDYDEGVTGVDLGDVDQDSDDEGFTQNWDNSPLRRAGAGATSTIRGKLFS